MGCGAAARSTRVARSLTRQSNLSASLRSSARNPASAIARIARLHLPDIGTPNADTPSVPEHNIVHDMFRTPRSNPSLRVRLAILRPL